MCSRTRRKFYERLGDDIANELVDWFNAVDATYQSQLRELNEANYRRFLADLRGEMAAVKTRLDGHDARFVALDARMSSLESRMGSVEVAIRSLGPELSEKLIKWMFGFFTATVLSLGGLMVGLQTFK
jgi:hypothetical protein